MRFGHLIFRFKVSKSFLIRYAKKNRIHFSDYVGNNKDKNSIFKGADFTYIEYAYNSTPPSVALGSIAFQVIKYMEDNKIVDVSKGQEYLYDFNNHYNLLTAIASTTKSKKIIEIGTASGSSLWAWLQSNNVKEILTWDVDTPIPENSGWLPNISVKEVVHNAIVNDSRWTQYIENLTDHNVWSLRCNQIKDADIIFIDGPHDGYTEVKLMNNISSLNNNKQILLLFDDIKVSSMVRFWDLLNLEKLDLTSIGHQSGTGIALLPKASTRHGNDIFIDPIVM
jgi:hypothetical protein